MAQPSFARCMRPFCWVIFGRKKAAEGKLVLAWHCAVPGVRLCPALRGHPAGAFALRGAFAVQHSIGTLCAAGRLLKQGKTSNWLAFDLLNAAVACALGQLYAPARCAFGGGGKLFSRRKSVPGGARKGAGAKRVCAVLGGVLAGLLCLCLVLPPLMQADAGFAALLEGFTQRFSSFVENLFRPLNMGTFLLKWMFALPTALFLYGTVYGSVRGARTWHLQQAGGVRALQRVGCACCRAPRWPRPYARCVRHMCCSLPCRPDICSAPSGVRFRRAFPMRNMQGRPSSSCAGWRL